MAIITNCNQIIAAYTYCSRVIAIYTNCSMVSPDFSMFYYIKWTPSDPASWGANASFSIDGSTYYFRNYSGEFRGYDGVITESAFYQDVIRTLKTNAIRIESSAFYQCSRLSSVNLVACSYIGEHAFEYCHMSNNLVSSFKLTAYRCTYVAQNAFHSTGLKSIYFPICSYVGKSAFLSCTSLSSISLPHCTYVDSRAFGGCIISSVYLPECSYVGSYGFNANPLNYIDLPECEYLGSGALNPASNVTYLSLPKCKYVGNNALRHYCGKIQHSMYLPVCEYIGESAVAGDGGTFLNSVDLPVCSHIGGWGFANQNELQTISLPECKFIGSFAFVQTAIGGTLTLPKCEFIGSWAFTDRFNGVKLRNVYLPALKRMSEWAFEGAGVSYISLPVCEYIDRGGIQHCSLESINLPVCSYIGGGAFLGNSSFSMITLGYSSVCFLSVDVFSGTSITATQGSIFVPSSLVNAYKSADNWSYYSNIIFPISEP